MTTQWVSVEARTGKVIADLVSLSCDAVSVALGTHTATTAGLHIGGAPENWQRATLPYGSCLVLLDDDTDDGHEVPLWGGIVTKRTRSAGDVVDLSLSTWEAYLARRYTGNRLYTNVEQCTLVSQLVTAAVLDGSVPLRVEVTAGTTTRTREYEDIADKTVLAALEELSAVQGGPEWTIGWERLSDPERYRPVLRVADRIGIPATAGMGPAVTFDLPGSLTAAELVEDWQVGSGATSVVATSSPDGNTRPQSPAEVSGDMDRPTIEHRWSPSTSITQAQTLIDHARARLALMRDGASSLSLTSGIVRGRRLGFDWGIGDDIGYDVDSPVLTLSGVARAAGWVMSLPEPRTVTPILASTEVAG